MLLIHLRILENTTLCHYPELRIKTYYRISGLRKIRYRLACANKN